MEQRYKVSAKDPPPPPSQSLILPIPYTHPACITANAKITCMVNRGRGNVMPFMWQCSGLVVGCWDQEPLQERRSHTPPYPSNVASLNKGPLGSVSKGMDGWGPFAETMSLCPTQGGRGISQCYTYIAGSDIINCELLPLDRTDFTMYVADLFIFFILEDNFILWYTWNYLCFKSVCVS